MVFLAGLPPSDDLHAVWLELHKRQEEKEDGVSAGVSFLETFLPASAPERFRRLIASLLTVDPNQRPSAAQALADNADWLLPPGAIPLAVSDDVAKNPRNAASPSAEISDDVHPDVNRCALHCSIRSRFDRAASFLLSVVTDPKQVRSLILRLREAGVSDNDAVPVALLESTLWHVDARAAACQIKLLRVHTLDEIFADTRTTTNAETPSRDEATWGDSRDDVDLGVEMSRIVTLAELQRVEGDDSWIDRSSLKMVRRLSLDEGDVSVREGALMAMLTRWDKD